MERLSIPLGYTSTTRPSRRVVWLLVALCGLLMVLGLANLWFGRLDIASTAPEGTQIVFRLQPGRKNWDAVLKTIGDIPVVSSRGLTLRDVAAYSSGDIALFVDEEGNISTAVRADPSRLPHSLFDAYGVSIQSMGRDLSLLADREQPLTHLSLSRPWTMAPWSLFSQTVGSAHLFTNNHWVNGSLVIGPNGWEWLLPRLPLTRLPWKELPSETIFAFATPAMGDHLDLSGVTTRMDALLAPFNVPSLGKLASDLLSGGGLIVLTERENGWGYLLSGPDTHLDADARYRLLTTSIALKNPQTRVWTLADGTTTQELRADPSAVTLEDRVVFGSHVLTGHPSPTESLFLADQHGQYAIGNDLEIISAWLSRTFVTTKKTDRCHDGSYGYIHLRSLFAHSASSLPMQRDQIMRLLSERFEHIAIKNTPFFTSMKLCF